MPKPKIDIIKLNRMLRAGKSQREVAQVFGVTESAVSKKKKELNFNVIKSIALENAGRVVDKNLNTVGQLQKINNYANQLLEHLMAWCHGDSESLQQLERQIDNVESLKEFKSKDPRELALKAMAEIRGQLKLQLEIFQSLFDMQAVEQFQKEVLSVIGEVRPDVREQIICRLQERKALRKSIDLPGE